MYTIRNARFALARKILLVDIVRSFFTSFRLRVTVDPFCLTHPVFWHHHRAGAKLTQTPPYRELTLPEANVTDQTSVRRQENKELRNSLEEHQNTLEIVMSNYRKQVTQLMEVNRADRQLQRSQPPAAPQPQVGGSSAG